MSKIKLDDSDKQSDLTSVASERVALERCVAYLRKEAGDAFVRQKDEYAKLIRALADEIDKWRKDATQRQEVLLKELHPEIYK